MPDLSLTGGFDSPFQEQVNFFRAKLNLGTATWLDIKHGAHDRSFVVAGAMKADLLDDLRQAVEKGIAQGTTLETFRNDFRQIVFNRGWHGWTGEGTLAGFNWRTKVIYETNLRSAYAAGRWKQLNDPGLKQLMPYWRYVHNDSVLHPRPLHLQWGSTRLTLPSDHPFWKTHFPPNGWGCRCRVVAATGPKAGDATAPPEGWDAIAEKTGEPVGIDKGWGYAPGANATTPLKDLIDQKLIKLDAPIGAAMWETLKPALAGEMSGAVVKMVEATAQSMRHIGDAALVHVVAPRTVADLAGRGFPMESADVWLRDEELLHALRHTKDARGATLPVEVWRDLPSLMAGAEPYLDTHDAALVYAFNLQAGVGKVLVRVNYADKIRQQGKRTRLTSNFVRTGGMAKQSDIENGSQYLPLEK